MIAFVEGKMERQFLNINMKYIRVIPVQNGISWTLQRMSEQITDAYRALNMACDVIIWIDREARDETSREIADCIRNALTQCGANPDAIHILINDRMVENLILADEIIIRDFFEDNDYCYTHKGKSGKYILKEMFKNNKGSGYKETRDGLELLRKVRPRRSALTCEAVAHFFDNWTGNCWWLDQ